MVSAGHNDSSFHPWVYLLIRVLLHRIIWIGRSGNTRGWPEIGLGVSLHQDLDLRTIWQLRGASWSPGGSGPTPFHSNFTCLTHGDVPTLSNQASPLPRHSGGPTFSPSLVRNWFRICISTADRKKKQKCCSRCGSSNPLLGLPSSRRWGLLATRLSARPSAPESLQAAGQLRLETETKPTWGLLGKSRRDWRFWV